MGSARASSATVMGPSTPVASYRTTAAPCVVVVAGGLRAVPVYRSGGHGGVPRGSGERRSKGVAARPSAWTTASTPRCGPWRRFEVLTLDELLASHARHRVHDGPLMADRWSHQAGKRHSSPASLEIPSHRPGPADPSRTVVGPIAPRAAWRSRLPRVQMHDVRSVQRSLCLSPASEEYLGAPKTYTGVTGEQRKEVGRSYP